MNKCQIQNSKSCLFAYLFMLYLKGVGKFILLIFIYSLIYLFFYLFIYLFFYLFIYLIFYLFIYIFICPMKNFLSTSKNQSK